MKKSTIASLVALAFSPSAFAAETTNIHTNDVVVTANRITQNKDAVLADVTIIDRAQIERSGQSTLAELLSVQSGIEMESNGGVGATSNIHIRGNSSQAVVVLIDGMRVASATLGTTSFSQIQPEQIERIEILRGPASSLYGSDAIGGVIQIFTKQGAGDLHLTASTGYGSYNTQQAAATISGATEKVRFAAGITSLTTNGISSLKTNSGLDADNDAFRNLSFNGNMTVNLADGHNVGAQIYTSQGHYNFDGDNFPAHQDLRQEAFSATSNNKILDTWTSHLRIGKSTDTLDSLGSFGSSYLRTTQLQFSWQNDIKLPLGNLVLAYDRLEDKVKGSTNFSQTKRFNNGYMATYLLEQDAHAFKIGMRSDYNSQFGSHATGNIAYGYKLNDFWKASASYGTAYRAPTFNDLYWPLQDFGAYGTYQGNPNLKPETSRNKEIGVVFDEGHHRATATIFHNKVDNLIVCCQGLFNDSAANIGSATIRGISMTYEGWVSNYHVRANADFQDPKNDDNGKVLARRSKEHGAIWLGQHWGDWELGSELSMSGKRYNDSDNAIKLAGYSLLNITTKYNVNEDWSINARVNNLLDKQYALATTASSFNLTSPDYNTMGTNLFVSVRYSPIK
jgi:vitamin B12 transporter